MKYIQILFLFFSLIFLPKSGQAQKLKVAVAANAQFVMEEIKQAFQKQSGIEVDLIISSSGKLTTQIQNGAPFDVFLSADMQYPAVLHRAGLTQAAPKIYAYGSLVLWTLDNEVPDKSLKMLTQANLRNIAIANPALAPYGEAAVSALKYYQLYDAVKNKLVFGESVAQVNQYITSGSASVGFTAKSVVLDPAMQGKGHWVEIDRKAYKPIAQGVVLLKTATVPSAQKFYTFLFSPQAQALFRKYGYLGSGQLTINNDQ
ncbi:MAG: molybdate ABC transporter substrate-binding protein [Bacteroidota bacterium]